MHSLEARKELIIGDLSSRPLKAYSSGHGVVACFSCTHATMLALWPGEVANDNPSTGHCFSGAAVGPSLPTAK